MFFNLLAKILAIPFVADWIIKHAQKTPYFHLDGYMGRWWFFNGYGDDHIPKHPWWPWSYRVHHIISADYDRHKHDHPTDCRTFVLKNWYKHSRLIHGDDLCGVSAIETMKAGTTGTLKFGEYHSITEVAEGGVWTLFCLGRQKGEWGFMVEGKKVPWREYLATWGKDK
jgi:hypothetical protein